MSRLKLLDTAEARRFDLPPLLTRQQQAHYFTLPPDGLPPGGPAQFRKPVTRIGFCLLWGYFRLTQKFFRAADFHPTDIDYVSQLFQSQPVDLADYSAQIAWEHQQLILNVLHIKPFEAYRDSFSQLVYGLFEQPLLPRKVLEESRQHLIRQRVEVPSYDVFLRIITDQYNRYGRRLSGQLEQHLTEVHRQALEQLIQTDTAYERPLLQAFKTVSQVEQPKAIKASLTLFKQVKTIFEQVEGAVTQLDFSDATAPADRLSHYAHRTGQDRPAHIKEHDRGAGAIPPPVSALLSGASVPGTPGYLRGHDIVLCQGNRTHHGTKTTATVLCDQPATAQCYPADDPKSASVRPADRANPPGNGPGRGASQKTGPD